MYDAIYRRWVFPELDRRRGYDLFARIAQFECQLSSSASEITASRDKRLQSIVEHAASTSRFWEDRFRAAGLDPTRVRSIEDLAALPLLEKDEVREHRDAMLSSAVPAVERREAMTGGSTAAPLRFYRDPGCLADREASNWVFYRRMGRQPYDRWALVWGAMRDLSPTQSLKSRLRSRWLDRCVILPGNRMDPESMDQFVARMRAFRPRFLHGYAQAIFLLARRIADQGLVPPRLEAISVTAEAIGAVERETVEQAFRAPVYSMYGTREFGMLSAECPAHAGMHLNPLSTIVEILGPDGEPAPPGEPGQVVVTDLLNRAMPLIRYRIGDVGVMREGFCACGNQTPVLDIAAGRETDFIITGDGRWISGASITLVNSPGVARLQYVQKEPGELTVRYQPTGAYDSATLHALEEKLVEVFGAGFRFNYERVEDIPLTPSGKFVYVFSEAARRRFGRQPVLD